jgi:hypothetical protein
MIPTVNPGGNLYITIINARINLLDKVAAQVMNYGVTSFMKPAITLPCCCLFVCSHILNTFLSATAHFQPWAASVIGTWERKAI